MVNLNSSIEINMKKIVIGILVFVSANLQAQSPEDGLRLSWFAPYGTPRSNALGGAMGGYTTAKKEVIEILRQRSRPYLFSNSLAPSIVGASLKVFELLEKDTTLRDKLEWNTNYFKAGLRKSGIDFIDGDSAIVPVMLYDAKLSQIMAEELLKKGIYVIGFFFPVVPKDKARIRVQLSAAHTQAHLDKAIEAFTEVAKNLGIIK